MTSSSHADSDHEGWLPPCSHMVLLTEGSSTPFLAKTAISLLRYRGEDVVAVLDSENCGATAQQLFGTGGDIPVIASLDEVPEADSLVIGIAPPGGKVPHDWRPILFDAIRRNMDIVSSLHDFLSDDPELIEIAAYQNVRIVDVRRNNERDTSDCITFRPECLRIHTVGNDCSLGKMVTTLEMQRELSKRGFRAGFAATGQTGIMISGAGVPIDSVVADFVNGAAERLVQRMQNFDYLLIEGQGSIVHPRYSGVSLGLLHGCAPDGLILCYEVGREFIKGLDHIPITPFKKLIGLHEEIASCRHPCKVIGISMNSRLLDDAAADLERERVRKELGLPICDVYRHGPGELVDAAIKLKGELNS